MENAGKKLRAAREKKRISLDEAAAATKIKVDHLRALEEGDTASLPSPAYARGFIKIYGRYLDIDPAALLKQYEDSFRGSQPELVLIEQKKLAAVPLLPPLDWRKAVRYLGLAAAAAAALWFASRLLSFVGSRVPESEFGLVEPIVPPGGGLRLDPSLVMPSPPPVVGELLLEGRAREELWLEVFSDGTLVHLGPLRPDAIGRWRAADGFRVRLSRSDRVEFTLNRRPVSLPDSGGEPVGYSINRRGVTVHD